VADNVAMQAWTDASKATAVVEERTEDLRSTKKERAQQVKKWCFHFPLGFSIGNAFCVTPPSKINILKFISFFVKSQPGRSLPLQQRSPMLYPHFHSPAGTREGGKSSTWDTDIWCLASHST
jgi:hypothetical protein